MRETSKASIHVWGRLTSRIGNHSSVFGPIPCRKIAIREREKERY